MKKLLDKFLYMFFMTDIFIYYFYIYLFIKKIWYVIFHPSYIKLYFLLTKGQVYFTSIYDYLYIISHINLPLAVKILPKLYSIPDSAYT
jgi:hypothetical protein